MIVSYIPVPIVLVSCNVRSVQPDFLLVQQRQQLRVLVLRIYSVSVVRSSVVSGNVFQISHSHARLPPFLSLSEPYCRLAFPQDLRATTPVHSSCLASNPHSTVAIRSITLVEFLQRAIPICSAVRRCSVPFGDAVAAGFMAVVS